MNEVVLDANIFAHASNPDNDFYDSAAQIVIGILDSDLYLALDDTGKASPSVWTSNIYREYVECISPISTSYAVINALLQANRVTFHRRPSKAKWDHCKRLLPRNNHDAIVLAVGLQSPDHVVVSNDYLDFNTKVRRLAKRELGVDVIDSTQFSYT